MDPAAAKALAGKMTKTAETINQAVQALTSAVDGVNWKGPDAERFKQDWRGSCAPSVKKVADMLRTHATKLTQEAQQQAQASGM
jgi:WXG100 family type VII secretion target